MRFDRLIAPAVIMVLLGACGQPKTFKGSQLSRILLGSTDTIPGLQYIPQQSGPQALQYISKDKAEDAKLTEYGFESAYASFFANTGAVAVFSGQTENADPNAREVAIFGAVFKTADGAHKALLLEHQRDVLTGTDIKVVLVAKIGDETLAESGTQAGALFPGYLV